MNVLSTLLTSMSTAVVFVGCLAFAFYMVFGRWYVLARSFSKLPDGPAMAERRWQFPIFSSPSRAKPLFVPTIVGICEQGIAIRSYQPLSWALPALFLPFEQMRLSPTDHAGDREAWVIGMAGHRDVEIVLTGELLSWLLPQVRGRTAAQTL